MLAESLMFLRHARLTKREEEFAVVPDRKERNQKLLRRKDSTVDESEIRLVTQTDSFKFFCDDGGMTYGVTSPFVNPGIEPEIPNRIIIKACFRQFLNLRHDVHVVNLLSHLASVKETMRVGPPSEKSRPGVQGFLDVSILEELFHVWILQMFLLQLTFPQLDEIESLFLDVFSSVLGFLVSILERDVGTRDLHLSVVGKTMWTSVPDATLKQISKNEKFYEILEKISKLIENFHLIVRCRDTIIQVKN